MNNIKRIAFILRVCRVIRSLKSAKMQLAQTEVDLTLFPDLIKQLEDILQETNLKISFFNEKVKRAISSLTGFDPEKHVLLDYISIADIEDGYIDITKNGTDMFYLRLSDGRIVSTEDVPKEAKEDFNLNWNQSEPSCTDSQNG